MAWFFGTVSLAYLEGTRLRGRDLCCKSYSSRGEKISAQLHFLLLKHSSSAADVFVQYGHIGVALSPHRLILPYLSASPIPSHFLSATKISYVNLQLVNLARWGGCNIPLAKHPKPGAAKWTQKRMRILHSNIA